MMVFRDCTSGARLCAPESAVCVTANDDHDCGASAYADWCSEPDVWYFIVVGGVEEAYGTIDLTVMGEAFLRLTPSAHSIVAAS